MQAILTKFHGPTNTRGSRYSAQCAAGKIVVSADHALNADENHVAACKALCDKITASNAEKYGTDDGHTGPWSAPRVCGQLQDGSYAHVFVV